MRANELLLWLSARHEGSWRQFRAAVEELQEGDADASQEPDQEDDDFSLYQLLRLNLERLGHAEFFAQACEKGWRVTPPTIAVNRIENGWLGILCGARSKNVIERFKQTTNNNARCVVQLGAPDAWLVNVDTEAELAALSHGAGFGFQPDAPLALLLHLPPVPIGATYVGESELPLGRDWVVRAFDARALRWRKVTRDEVEAAREGYFRFNITFQRARHFLRIDSRVQELPRALGLYAYLHHIHRGGLLHYDHTTCQLVVPGTCRPPILVERALTLCSGRIPEFDSSSASILYREVPKNIAGFTANLLHQRLA